MRPRRRTFEELVSDNKEKLLKDQQAIIKIEEKLEQKHVEQLKLRKISV